MIVGKNETTSVLVKLHFFELRSKYYSSNEEAEQPLSWKKEIVCLAQELILDKNDRSAGSLHLDKKYIWAAIPSNPNEFKYQFIPVEARYGYPRVKGRFIDINRP